MSRIDELIAQHCPNGVVVETLADVAKLKRGTSITKKLVTEGNIPVVAGGRSAAYLHGEFNRDGETIVVAGSGAYAGFVSWWEGPIFVSDAFSVQPEPERLLPKFCYHWLSSQQAEIHNLKSRGGVPHVYAKDVGRLRIPVPPLEVQRAIVEVLDTFSKLEAELEAELEARKQQYEHYQVRVFEALLSEGAQSVPLQDLGKWYGGGTPSKARADFWTDGTIPWVSPKDMGSSSVLTTEDYITAEAVAGSATKLVPEGSVALVARSSILEHTLPVAHIPIAVALNQDMKAVVPKAGISDRYVFHALRAARSEMLRKVKRTGGSVASLDSSKLWGFEIPVPSPSRQEEVASLFDKFDVLVNDLTVGLPAELAARQQQYEYYRDKLLTFKELEVAV